MLGCVHYWRQDPDSVRAPFRCILCGTVRTFETNFYDLVDQKNNNAPTHQHGSDGARQSHPATPGGHKTNGTGPTESAGPETVPENNPEHAVSIPRKVLVVDDEALTGLMIKRLLEDSLGYQVETALRGQEAVEIAEQLQPDVTLLDIRMPDMDGFEVCRRLKESPWASSNAVIYISAYTAPDGDLPCGFGYLNKPVNPSTLLSVVRSAIAEKE